MSVTLSNALPDTAAFITMRADCGWGKIEPDRAERALANALATVSAHDGDRLVGFGRVLGDGALYFYLQDIVVAPSHRGQGLAETMVQRLLDDIAPFIGPGATVGLMAAKGVEPLYEKFGFQRRPSDRAGAGMTRVY